MKIEDSETPDKVDEEHGKEPEEAYDLALQ